MREIKQDYERLKPTHVRVQIVLHYAEDAPQGEVCFSLGEAFADAVKTVVAEYADREP